jgi:hypothetical protein
MQTNYKELAVENPGLQIFKRGTRRISGRHKTSRTSMHGYEKKTRPVVSRKNERPKNKRTQNKMPALFNGDKVLSIVSPF